LSIAGDLGREGREGGVSAAAGLVEGHGGLGLEAMLEGVVDGVQVRAQENELPAAALLLVPDHLEDLVAAELAAGVLLPVGDHDEDDFGGPVVLHDVGHAAFDVVDAAADRIQQRQEARGTKVSRVSAGTSLTGAKRCTTS
jgi:hypothetical protein